MLERKTVLTAPLIPYKVTPILHWAIAEVSFCCHQISLAIWHRPLTRVASPSQEKALNSWTGNVSIALFDIFCDIDWIRACGGPDIVEYSYRRQIVLRQNGVSYSLWLDCILKFVRLVILSYQNHCHYNIQINCHSKYYRVNNFDFGTSALGWGYIYAMFIVITCIQTTISVGQHVM